MLGSAQPQGTIPAQRARDHLIDRGELRVAGLPISVLVCLEFLANCLQRLIEVQALYFQSFLSLAFLIPRRTEHHQRAEGDEEHRVELAGDSEHDSAHDEGHQQRDYGETRGFGVFGQIWQLESACSNSREHLRGTVERNVGGFANGLGLPCLDELDLRVTQGHDVVWFHPRLMHALVAEDSAVG